MYLHLTFIIVLTELTRDPDRMVLTAEKGVALVVIDKEEYKQKTDNLLDQLTS